MTIDWITTPVSEDAPAGPDLMETVDPAFDDYYFNAVGRLPEAQDYVRIGMKPEGGHATPDRIFDPKSVKLAAELKNIDALLQRSRDLRLLTLRTQWAVLAGNLETAVDSVTAMADLLEAMPEEAHPIVDGDTRDRLEAINDLQQMGAMILPLRYLDLLSTGTSLRRIMVVRGEATAHDGEHDLDEADMMTNLLDQGEELEGLRDQVQGFLDALTRITAACEGHSTRHSPQLSGVANELTRILTVIGEAEPSLSGAPAAAALPTGDGPEGDAPPRPAASAAETVQVALRPATEVTSHEDAKNRLIAVETYFHRKEPSSATLLLVTQSRLLIGKSLIDAFDTLMPSVADQAKVHFRPESGFQLAHDKLRDLADQAGSESLPDPEPEEDDGSDPPIPAPPPPRITNATEAANQIKVVEAYFRAVEKSSPIPMLLARANAYVGKDFETLMKEFIPKQD
jgi:type VI secretion system protein ImpA